MNINGFPACHVYAPTSLHPSSAFPPRECRRMPRDARSCDRYISMRTQTPRHALLYTSWLGSKRTRACQVFVWLSTRCGPIGTFNIQTHTPRDMHKENSLGVRKNCKVARSSICRFCIELCTPPASPPPFCKVAAVGAMLGAVVSYARLLAI